MTAITILEYDEKAAREAYLIHVALIATEIQDPTLKDMPRWQALRAQVYQQFHDLFEVHQ